MFLSVNFLAKIENLGLKIYFRDFRAKIKIFSIHNLLNRKLATVCRKTVPFCTPPPYFWTHNAANGKSNLTHSERSKMYKHEQQQFTSVQTIK